MHPNKQSYNLYHSEFNFFSLSGQRDKTVSAGAPQGNHPGGRQQRRPDGRLRARQVGEGHGAAEREARGADPVEDQGNEGGHRRGPRLPRQSLRGELSVEPETVPHLLFVALQIVRCQ